MSVPGFLIPILVVLVGATADGESSAPCRGAAEIDGPVYGLEPTFCETDSSLVSRFPFEPGLERGQFTHFESFTPVPEKVVPPPGQTRVFYVSVIVGPDGRVLQACLAEPVDELFDRLLLETALKWRFSVGTLNGVPVSWEAVVPYAVSNVDP